jgi:beta-lactamase regulating signal transducer with metallopeptidase domain
MTAALDQLARISAERLLNSMFEGIAIGLFAWILLQVVGRRNSSTRFAVWFSALLAIAVLPVFGGAASSASSANTASSAITVPVSWALCLFVIWAVGASVALLRVGVGLWQLRKLRASCPAIDAATLDPVLRTTLQTFQAIRSVELRQSGRLQVPTAIGFLKPAVVLPTWAMQDLSTEELNAILIHELAHLRRRDDWTNLAQQIVKALLFFHPAVWWIEGKLALEREMACDDAVLAETANPRGYAQCLISMAEKSFLRRTVALAQAAVNRVHQTSLRVSQILDANRSRATRVWKPALYCVAAFFVTCLVSLSHAPELVAFKDRVPEVTVASATAANETLTTPASVNVRESQAVATPATFRTQSAAETQTHRSAEDASSVVPENTEYGMRVGTTLPQNADYRPREGTSSLLPKKTNNNSGLQFLRQGISSESSSPAEAELDRRYNPGPDSALLLEANFVPPDAGKFAHASTAMDHNPAPQAIFVMMQTTQYDQEGPTLWTICVWHVTVVDSSRIPAETRIPAKKI